MPNKGFVVIFVLLEFIVTNLNNEIKEFAHFFDKDGISLVIT